MWTVSCAGIIPGGGARMAGPIARLAVHDKVEKLLADGGLTVLQAFDVVGVKWEGLGKPIAKDLVRAIIDTTEREARLGDVFTPKY